MSVISICFNLRLCLMGVQMVTDVQGGMCEAVLLEDDGFLT